MSEPLWLTKTGLLILHDRSLALHGGLEGIKDEGLLDSAFARPLNQFHYEGVEDIPQLAAHYAEAISGNHPFIDGNKRTAFLAAGLFLDKNGMELNADPQEAIAIIMSLAAGELKVDQLAEWLRRNAQAS